MNSNYLQAAFDQYYESLYKKLHSRQDYEKISLGYDHWYYDCLPPKNTARILDIGCGDGKFLQYLKTRKYNNVEGLEICSFLAKFAREQTGCVVHTVDDTVAFLHNNKSCYNTITMNDVLEHIPKENIICTISAIKDSLVPGGNFIINVPNAAGLTGLYCRYNDFTHQTLFTDVSLRQVLLLGGFQYIRFIEEKWPFKYTFRHIGYRMVRSFWFFLLRLVYFIEQPFEVVPRNFQNRIMASAFNNIN